VQGLPPRRARARPWEGEGKHFTRDFEAFALPLMREMRPEAAGTAAEAAPSGTRQDSDKARPPT